MPTSLLTTNSRGFTLIEMMIVMAVIAAVIAVVAPKLQGNRSQIQRTLRQMVVLTRELHQNARLQNKNYRIAIKMDPKEGSSYWVESSSNQLILRTPKQREEDERSTRGSRDDKPVTSDFTMDSKMTKSPHKLPGDLKFEAVQTPAFTDPVNEGTAYIHFFAQGINEEGIINLTTGGTTHWSVVIHPLTGQSHVEDRYVTLKELHP